MHLAVLKLLLLVQVDKGKELELARQQVRLSDLELLLHMPVF